MLWNGTDRDWCSGQCVTRIHHSTTGGPSEDDHCFTSWFMAYESSGGDFETYPILAISAVFKIFFLLGYDHISGLGHPGCAQMNISTGWLSKYACVTECRVPCYEDMM